jgi:hypothetical protein
MGQLDLFGSAPKPEEPAKDSQDTSSMAGASSPEQGEGGSQDQGTLTVASGRPPNSPPPAEGKLAPYKGSYATGQSYPLPCIRCQRIFEFSWHWGKVVCPPCDGGAIAEPAKETGLESPTDGRCIVIGCVAVSESSVAGFPVCQAHANAPMTRQALEDGRFPGLFAYEGKQMILPTRRLLSGELEEGEGLFDKSSVAGGGIV